MSDGAHLGVGAERALKTILGGAPPPADDEQMSPEDFARYVREAPEQPADYGDCARLIARRLLVIAEAHPEIDWRAAPADDAIELPPARTGARKRHDDFDWRWKNRRVVREGVATLWTRLDPEGYRATMDATEPTGFQFGWAVNAVRTILGHPPTANPALLEIRS